MAFIRVDDEISLEPPKFQFAEAIFLLVEKNRAYLQRWLPWVEFSKSLSNTEDFFIRAQDGNKNGSQLVNIILYRGIVAGVISFNKIEIFEKRAEIGYWIGAEHQGKGIVTKCCRALTEYGFQKLDINRITILMAEENKKSKAIPERLGYKYEGTLREYAFVKDQFLNMRLYSFLKREWQAGKLKNI